ncbi:hypothetical protein V6Z11_D10G215900 [Gossypium hirsutum]
MALASACRSAARSPLDTCRATGEPSPLGPASTKAARGPNLHPLGLEIENPLPAFKLKERTPAETRFMAAIAETFPLLQQMESEGKITETVRHSLIDLTQFKQLGIWIFFLFVFLHVSSLLARLP